MHHEKKHPAIKRRTFVETKLCVACGCCKKACPLAAIDIHKGMYAYVNEACVACGLCVSACPASVISLVEVAS